MDEVLDEVLDVLAFSPHPDDAELYCAGTLLLLKQQGLRVGIADLTRGELSTRGTEENRAAETAEAARILDLHVRINLDLPDGALANTPEQRLPVVQSLRRLQPRTVLLPYPRDRHPDHEHASELLRDAMYLSGLLKLTSEDAFGVSQRAWRPSSAYYYMLSHDFEPTFIVDISTVHEKKLAAIRAYRTQFHTETYMEGPETYVSSPDFLAALIGRSRRLGFLIGAEYGEGFVPLQAQRFEAQWLLSVHPR